MKITKENIQLKLIKLLGEPIVLHSQMALPELLKVAAVEIFYNCDQDNDLGDTSYMVRMLLSQLKEKGFITFDE
jgi:hypothetical protein